MIALYRFSCWCCSWSKYQSFYLSI